MRSSFLRVGSAIMAVASAAAVVSELRKPRPHGGVVAWLNNQEEHQLFLQTIAGSTEQEHVTDSGGEVGIVHQCSLQHQSAHAVRQDRKSFIPRQSEIHRSA